MRLDELERELRAERPEVDPDFANRLDEWAARGFPRGGEVDPRRSRHGGGAFPPSRLRRAWRRLRATPPRRILAPVSAAATLVIIVGVAVTQIEPTGDDQAGDDAAISADEPGDDAGAATFEESPGGDRALRPNQGPGAILRESAAGRTELDAGRRGALDNTRANFADAGPNQRRIAQTISLSLATSPDEFRDAADGVLDVVGDHNGFVIRSRVSSGDPDVEGSELGRASLQLRIPAAQLQAALGDLSDLGHVVSRTDGSQDITARFESARDRIDTYTKSRDDLLTQLEEAVLETEQESIERRLRIVERRLASARDDLARAQQRVRLVPVSVEITADESIEDTGGWGVGDAFDDAQEILRVALGVALISAAVLLPLALIALLAFLASRVVARHQRERALDQPEG